MHKHVSDEVGLRPCVTTVVGDSYRSWIVDSRGKRKYQIGGTVVLVTAWKGHPTGCSAIDENSG